ncbi:MAG: hypothetical protein JWP02_1113 [Acidimicrobiales bacterium]|nr:hypothetical protein [Acidimicrobiales bacterium]
MVTAWVGPAWPWHGSSLLGGIALGAVMLTLVAVLPVGWWVLRQRFGHAAAGPLWPLVLFEVLALAYALVVPPWQKPDEPQHMVHVEVTRLAGIGAAEKLLPFKAPDPRLQGVERRVERDIAASMRSTEATRWLPNYRDAIAAGHAPGISELTHPPLYYVVSGILLRPFGSSPVVARLAILRLLGVVMAGCVVWCCGAAGRLLFAGRGLAELPAVLAVAIPGFVLAAGSVNNDVLSELLAALLLLLLLAGVLERTPLARPLPWLSGIALLVGLGLLTKRTFLPIAIVAVIAVAVRLRRQSRAMLFALVVIEIAVAASVATGSYARLALWHRAAAAGSARCRAGSAGGWAICLNPSSFQVNQKLPLVKLEDLQDSDVRVDLMGRGSGQNPMLEIDLGTGGGASVFRSLQPLSDQWRLMTFQGHVPHAPPVLSLALTFRGAGQAYVQNVRLAPAGEAFANDIVNGSGAIGSYAAPRLLPGAAQRAIDSAVDSVNGLVWEPGTVADSRDIIGRRAAKTFGSFWATVGWQGALLLLPGPLPWLLTIVAVAGLVGFVAVFLRVRIPVRASVLLLAAVSLVIASVLLQTVPPDELQLVSGRYLYTGLVALTVVLAAGWRHLWPGTEAQFRVLARVFPFAMHGLFVGLVLTPFLMNGVRV